MEEYDWFLRKINDLIDFADNRNFNTVQVRLEAALLEFCQERERHEEPRVQLSFLGQKPCATLKTQQTVPEVSK